jgi:hypothetical protein
LEIIDDGTNPDLTSAMLKLINSSVSGTTTLKKDSLGLSFPDVAPKHTDSYPVKEIVVRSVYSYKFGESGYIVEIVVYRTWDKGCMKKEPRIESSMSMYHQVWDWQMAAVWNTTKARDWDPQLSCFFEGDGQQGGIPKFLEDIKFLQDFLAKASCP